MTVAEQPAARGRRGAFGTYVYGITNAGTTARARGIGDARVELVEHGELAAIASASPPTPIRAKRRDVLRHSDVLQDVLKRATVVPVRFGAVFASRESVVAELLAPRYRELAGLLHRFHGLVELSVRAVFRDEAVLADIVRSNPQIAGLRERTLAPAAPRGLKLELGEAVARALADRRARSADSFVAALLPLSRDAVVEEPRTEYEALRAAFLVERGRVSRFEARVQEAARGDADVMRVKLTGPLPPHSFVSLGGSGGR